MIKTNDIPEVSIIIPVFNEAGCIWDVVEELHKSLKNQFSYEIILVDDGSTDGLDFEGHENEIDQFHRHRVNMGYGAAIKTGLRHSMGEKIVITDADGTYPASAIPALVNALDDSEMAVGARTGAKVHIPFIRQPAKYILRKLADYLAERKIPDLNSGLRSFRKSYADNYLHLYPRGFSLTTTMTLAFLCDDLRVEYIAIDYRKRKGKSKIRPFRDTKNIVFTIIRTVLYFNPLKICLPFGVILFLLGMLVLLYSGLFLDRILDGTVSVLLLSSVQVVSIGLLADLIARRRGS